MRPDGLERALARAEQRLLSLPVLEALLARREKGCSLESDAGAAIELARVLCAERRADGSWDGSVSRTAENLLLLHELLRGAQDAGSHVADSLEWLLRRQDAAGRFGDPCTPDMHALALCEHGTAGLLAVAPADTDLTGLTLEHGASFLTDADARLGASSLGVAALLRWGVHSAGNVLHLDALTRVIRLTDAERARILSTTGFACVTLAAAAAPATHSVQRLLPLAIMAIARVQRADGSWPGAELFFVLDVLLELRSDAEREQHVRAPLQRAAALLLMLQQPDGSWGRQAGPWPLLIGWRTLRAALNDAPVAS